MSVVTNSLTLLEAMKIQDNLEKNPHTYDVEVLDHYRELIRNSGQEREYPDLYNLLNREIDHIRSSDGSYEDLALQRSLEEFYKTTALSASSLPPSTIEEPDVLMLDGDLIEVVREGVQPLGRAILLGIGTMGIGGLLNICTNSSFATPIFSIGAYLALRRPESPLVVAKDIGKTIVKVVGRSIAALRYAINSCRNRRFHIQ